MNKYISEYQCSGCIRGFSKCYEMSDNSISCENHHAGTFVNGIGKIYIGLPKGFNRIGSVNGMIIEIFENFYNHYDKFNIPVWKYKNENNHVLVRGLMPRINQPFLHIYLVDCLNKIECLEITKAETECMD